MNNEGIAGVNHTVFSKQMLHIQVKYMINVVVLELGYV